MTRIDAYREQTAPIIGYYRSRNVLKSVDGLQPVDAVTEQIFQVMERRQRAISNTVVEEAKSGRPGRSQVFDSSVPIIRSIYASTLSGVARSVGTASSVSGCRKGFGAGVRNRPNRCCERSIRLEGYRACMAESRSTSRELQTSLQSNG